MEIHSECYPCLVKQALDTLKIIGIDEELKKSIIVEVLVQLASSPTNYPPPYVSRRIYSICASRTGIRDPYHEIKKKSNLMVFGLLSLLRDKVKQSEDPVFEALRMTIVGNIIDYGAGRSFTLEDVSLFDRIPIAINHYDYFIEDLENSSTILYIGDNAGEIVFDRLFIEVLSNLNKKVYFAVRGKPIINDITMEDAIFVGIDRYAEIVDSGSDAPGVALDVATPRFKSLLDKADLVISKGQGNFETLENYKRDRLYFLLRVKCEVVAKILKAKIGDIIIARSDKI
ncbi:MAG: damage-control phosphatase ARMT1 family protein [Thermosulfidibacteraceae bacterium]|mgnify:CR=1 FL=1|jgi:uncharacterized protein with ATP-grasp and redox domains